MLSMRMAKRKRRRKFSRHGSFVKKSFSRAVVLLERPIKSSNFDVVIVRVEFHHVCLGVYRVSLMSCAIMMSC